MLARMKISPGMCCYACEEPATSVEHAPPKCFFPDRRDLPSGADAWRKDLIQVPSCAAHNQGKSGDDEYAACCIAMNAEGSELALSVFQGTRLRAMLRNDGSLGKRVFSTARPARNRDGAQTLAISYEVDRIHRVIEYTARALYFHHTGRRWPTSCIVWCPRIWRDSGRQSHILAGFGRLSAGFDELRRRHGQLGVAQGANPDVFWYQLIEAKPALPCIRLMFYSTFEFIVATADPAMARHAK